MRRVDETGQAAVELALITPVLLMFLIGVIDFGLVMHGWLMSTNAAREAARIVALGENDSIAIDAALQIMSYSADEVNVEISPAPPRPRGSDVTVNVSFAHRTITPFIGHLYSTIDVNGKAVMRVE